MAEETRSPIGGKLSSPGPHLARVVSVVDPTYMGILEVELLQKVGNYDSRETQTHQVRYITPFGGSTSSEYLTETDDYDSTQKSYGFWMVPPDPGNIVVVLFIDGEADKGYWFGCVQDQDMNFQVPGHAATQYHVNGKKKRVPVAEYNRKAKPNVQTDGTKNTKPASPLEKVLIDQGIIEDDTRGITTSSARRDLPSMVFGISTPGPIDQKGPVGKVGKHEHKIPNAKVSRLGGSTFVMDDGDDKWVRKTKPSEGPPDYANKENDETGLDEIPHNELIRLRTRTGHQILLHNSEDLIYIGNARGTAWIELSSDGKMDVYCEDSISFRTKNDFNFYADRDVNIEAGRNVNIKTFANFHVEAGAEYQILAGADGKLTAGGTTHIKSGSQHLETATQIHMNGPTAKAVEELSIYSNPDHEENVTNSIMLRIPSHEPWPHHENLNPTNFKPEKTDREAGASIPIPDMWKKYSTATDTFAKIGKKNTG
jgi:hypothetical protein